MPTLLINCQNHKLQVHTAHRNYTYTCNLHLPSEYSYQGCSKGHSRNIQQHQRTRNHTPHPPPLCHYHIPPGGVLGKGITVIYFLMLLHGITKKTNLLQKLSLTKLEKRFSILCIVFMPLCSLCETLPLIV